MIEIKQKITDKVLIVVKSETLRDADLSYANLRGADLSGADLRGADLRDANLRYADLSYANLSDADLRDANLRYADLSYANLSDADLSDANLRGADLSGADLRGADLSGANLRGAKGFIQWQSPQGEKRICCSVKHDKCIMHQLGCFWGNTNEAIKAIREKYGDDSMYEQLLALNAKALEI